MFNFMLSMIVAFVVMVTNSMAAALPVPAGLVVQFSARDLATVESAIKKAFDESPTRGRSDTPMASPYPFGVVTIRGVTYEFYPRLESLALRTDGLGVSVDIRQLSGDIDRVEFNESASMFCEKIPVRSSAIAVHIVAHPRTLPDGSLTLDIPVSDIDLNEQNFKVGQPENCDVVYGFNWLIKRALPSLIGSYKKEIAGALSQSLVRILQNRVVSLSPMMALQVTMPFNPGTMPSFYANIAVAPTGFAVNEERFQAFFSTDITIDPDEVTPFSEEHQWPADQSFVGFHWSLLDGMFSEASAKNVLKTLITTTGTFGRSWTAHEIWRQIWPDFSSKVSPEARLSLEIAGGPQYHWSSATDQTARLTMSHISLLLRTNKGYLATITANAVMDVTLTNSDTGELSAVITDFVIDPASARVVADSGLLEGSRVIPEGIAMLAESLRGQIKKSPAHQREVFKISLPPVKIGEHRVMFGNIKALGAGLILPLQYVDPQ